MDGEGDCDPNLLGRRGVRRVRWITEGIELGIVGMGETEPARVGSAANVPVPRLFTPVDLAPRSHLGIGDAITRGPGRDCGVR